MKSKQMEGLGILFVVCLCLICCQSLEFTKFVTDNTLSGATCSNDDIVFSQQSMNVLSCGHLCANSNSCTFMIYEAEHGLCTGCKDIEDDGPSTDPPLIEDGPIMIALHTVPGNEVLRKIPKCDSGWVEFQHMCYWLGDTGMEFAESILTCENLNSRLVHIETEQENTFLLNTLHARYHFQGNISVCAFIGVTDEDEDGIWRFYDTNATISFDDFQAPEPNNLNGIELCALFVVNVGISGWADASCYTPCLPLCEKAP